MKVLLLQSRPEQQVSDDEFEAFCRFGGLEVSEVERLHIHEAQPVVDIDKYDATIMAGGPSNFAYDDEHKSVEQKAFEPWLSDLLGEIVARDKPFFGACLGLGALVTYTGGKMSLDKSEPVGAVEIQVTHEGRDDPLLANLPDEFSAFVGHKEGVGEIPDNATVLAENDDCVQMLRVGKNVYGVQFHPELDPAGLALRIEAYRHAGYFEPEEADELIAAAMASDVGEAATLVLRNFVSRFR